jgi:hypothetical protein
LCISETNIAITVGKDAKKGLRWAKRRITKYECKILSRSVQNEMRFKRSFQPVNGRHEIQKAAADSSIDAVHSLP